MMIRVGAIVSLTLTMFTVGCQTAPTVATAKVDEKGKPPEPPKEVAKAAPLPALILPAGTVIEARIDEALSTERNRVGDKFAADLDDPIVIGGREVVARGARIEGHVTTSQPSGRLKGRATLGVTLDAIEVKGKMTPIATTLDARVSEAHKKRNIEIIAGGAGLGALIGGIAGGGKGAGIGAGAGAGAGTATAALTGKLHVEVPAETVFTFKLKAPVEVK